MNKLTFNKFRSKLKGSKFSMTQVGKLWRQYPDNLSNDDLNIRIADNFNFTFFLEKEVKEIKDISKIKEKVITTLKEVIKQKEDTHRAIKNTNKNELLKSYGPVIKKLGEGSYGSVNLHKLGEKSYAIKKIHYTINESIDNYSIIEVAILQRINHKNVLKLLDYKISKDLVHLYLVTDVMKRGSLIDYQIKDPVILKKLVYQLLCGVAYIHSLDIIHRDLKPQNILVDSDYTLKIADFGQSIALSCINPEIKNTMVVTLWYRPPELLYGGMGKQYGLSLDMWSVGCVIFEMITRKVIFFGSDPKNIRDIISFRLGDPNEIVWPGVSKYPLYKKDKERKPTSERTKKYITDIIKNQKVADIYFDIIMNLVKYDPSKRATALQSLKNPFFDQIRDKKLEATHHSCLENLYLVEKPINFTLNKYIDIDIRMKYILINWLISVSMKFRLRTRTYYIALYLHDSLNMLNFFTKRDDYQLYGVACLYIASLYNEIFPPEISDFIYITDNSYTEKQILNISTKIFNSINFKMIFSTCYDFNIEYGEFYSQEVHKLSKGLLYFVSTLPDELYQTKPDQVALMTIMMACMYYGEKFKHINRVTNDEIKNLSFCIDLKIDRLPSAKLLFKSAKHHYTDDNRSIEEVIRELCNNKLIT